MNRIIMPAPDRTAGNPPPPVRIRPGTRPAPWFEAFLVIVIAILLGIWLFDYGVCWAAPEFASLYLPGAARNGATYVPFDLLRSFDVWTMDGISRPRFVSYGVQIANVKFRLWLFRFLPPHPALSLTWPFTLLLTPLLFWRFLQRLTGSSAAAWSGTGILLASPGLLSGVFNLNHPAKPLSLAMLVAALWLAARLADSHCRHRRRDWSLLVLLLFLAVNTDEYALAIPPLIACLFPQLLRYRRGWGGFALFLVYPVFLLWVTFAVPPITAGLNFGRFDFWGIALHGNTENGQASDDSGSLVSRLHFINVINNLRPLLASHLLPLATPPRHSFTGWIDKRATRIVLPPAAIAAWAMAAIAVAAWLFIQLRSRQRRLAARLFLALLLFTVLHTLIYARHVTGIISACYYYGTFFSVLFAALAAILLSSPGHSRRPQRLALAALVLIGLSNFYFINQYFQHCLYEDTRPLALSRSEVISVWQARHDPSLSARLEAMPATAMWLRAELPLLP